MWLGNYVVLTAEFQQSRIHVNCTIVVVRESPRLIMREGQLVLELCLLEPVTDHASSKIWVKLQSFIGLVATPE